MYQVIDIQTKQIMKQCATSKAAHKVADRLDKAYGAVRYVVRFM